MTFLHRRWHPVIVETWSGEQPAQLQPDLAALDVIVHSFIDPPIPVLDPVFYVDLVGYALRRKSLLD
jgi:hypothetical protein